MRYLLIINPTSGNKKKEEIDQILTAVKDKFHDTLDILYTNKKGDATHFAYESTQDIVIVGGGDGTVNEAINGLMKKKKRKKPKLAIIPLGTSNIVGHELGLKKKNIREILELIDAERSMKLDIGKANGRFFVVACGIGLDAHAYEHVQPQLKKMVGEYAYPLAFLKTFVDYKPEQLFIMCNGIERTGYYILICNITKYRFVELIKNGKSYDGMFDVLIFQQKNLLDNLRYVYGILTRRHHTFKDVECIQCSSLVITAKNPVLHHVDAELNGTTPVKVEIIPKALEVIC